MIDIFALSPADLDRFLHLQALHERQKERQARIRALRDYYAGDHPIMLDDRQKEFLGEILTGSDFTFAHNLIKTIVDTLRERLSVQGFTVNGEDAEPAPDADPEAGQTPAAELARLLWHWWIKGRLDSKQIDLYRRALRDSVGYVIVGFDETSGRPSFGMHRADDGQAGITYHLDPEDNDQPLFACRYFYTYNPLEPGRTGIERKTVYLPHEIRKYIRDRSGQWAPYQDPGDEAWPIPWLDRAGKPLGIAVIPFGNPGGSEVEQVIGLQNGLNKGWLDLLAAADAAGFPILAAEYDASVDPGPEDDEDSVEDDEKIAPGMIIDLFGGKMKRIDPGNLDQLINVIWTITAAISGVSRTPQYYLRPIGGSDVPSGEALKQLESGLVSRAIERHLLFGQAWEDVFTLALKVADVYGTKRLPDVEEVEISTVWKDPGIRVEQTEAAVAEAHGRLGVPRPALYRRLGYSPQEIATFETERRNERTAELATLAAGLQRQQAAAADTTPTRDTAPQNAQASDLDATA